MSEPFYVAVTGHRPNKLGGYKPNTIQDRVRVAIKAQLQAYKVDHPYLVILTGMALGVDQWVAEACIELGIPYVACVPFTGQEYAWPADSQIHYQALIKKAINVVVVSDGSYSAYKMQVRNRYMVDRCDVLMAAWDGTPGGTGNCVNYATKVGKRMDVLKW